MKKEGGAADSTLDDILERYLAELAAQRSWVDVAVEVWFVIVLVVPLLTMYLRFPPTQRCCRLGCGGLWRLARLLARLLHMAGALEAGVYLLAFAVCVQGRCYPERRAEAGAWVSLAGAAAFPACFVYSTMAHGSEPQGEQEGAGLLTNAWALGGFLWASLLAPQAVAIGDAACGFLAVLAAYVGLVAILTHQLGLGDAPAEGGRWWCLLWRASWACAMASAALVATAMLLRRVAVGGWVTQRLLEAFAESVAILGHPAYFLAMTCFASRHNPGSDKWRRFIRRQLFVLFPVLAAFLAGVCLEVKALTSTAIVASLVWCCAKELEHSRTYLGVKILPVYMLVQFFYARPEHITNMIDPRGVYL